MDIYLHGIETIESDSGPRPVETIDTGIIGLVMTAPNASADIWPLNKCVEIHGYQGFPGGLGTGGTGPDAIRGIYDQATRASQTIVAVRVPVGVDDKATMANIIGDPLTKTGMQALRDAEAELGLKPKLLVAPGFTSMRPTDGVASVAVGSAGSGYLEPPIVSFASGAAAATAIINDEGEVTEIVVTSGGFNYGAPPAVTITPASAGSGATATVTVDDEKADSVTITSGGSGYKNPVVAFAGTGGSGAAGTVQHQDGVVTGITITNPGSGYTGAITATITDSVGSGATATATLGTVANPVAVALVSLANRLRAGAIVDGPNTTSVAAVTYSNDFATDRMLIVDPFVKVSKEGQIVSQPASARVAGLQARVDYDEGFWYPPSNHVVEGIVGTARVVEHSLSDPSAESQYLNKNAVATIVRSPSGGFKLWGSRVPSGDSLKLFWSVRRSHDAIIESIERAHEPFVDKPFSVQILLDIAETVNAALRRWRALGATLGGRVWLDRGLNTPLTWAAGHIYVSYDAEAPAPMEHITFVFNRNTGYYQELADDALREIARLSGRVI